MRLRSEVDTVRRAGVARGIFFRGVTVMRRLAAVFCLVFGLFPSARAEAARYTDPQGFSLDYPDGWRVASKQERDYATDLAKPLLDQIGRVDLSKIAAFIFCPDNDRFAENMNVVVTSGLGRVDDAKKREYCQALKSQCSQRDCGSRTFVAS